MNIVIRFFKQWFFKKSGSILFLGLFLTLSFPVFSQVNFPSRLQYHIDVSDAQTGSLVPLSGTYNVSAYLRSGDVTQNWMELFTQQFFYEGFTSLELGNSVDIDPDIFQINTRHICSWFFCHVCI